MKFNIGDHIKDKYWHENRGKIVDIVTEDGIPKYLIKWHKHEIKGLFRKSQVDSSYELDVQSKRNEVLNDILGVTTNASTIILKNN